MEINRVFPWLVNSLGRKSLLRISWIKNPNKLRKDEKLSCLRSLYAQLPPMATPLKVNRPTLGRPGYFWSPSSACPSIPHLLHCLSFLCHCKKLHLSKRDSISFSFPTQWSWIDWTLKIWLRDNSQLTSTYAVKAHTFFKKKKLKWKEF